MLELGFPKNAFFFFSLKVKQVSYDTFFSQSFKIFCHVQKTNLFLFFNRKKIKIFFTRIPESFRVSLINDIYLLCFILYLYNVDNSRGAAGIRNANKTVNVRCLITSSRDLFTMLNLLYSL